MRPSQLAFLMENENCPKFPVGNSHVGQQSRQNEERESLTYLMYSAVACVKSTLWDVLLAGDVFKNG